MEQLDLFAHCQRWRNRRTSYRPAGELFDPSRASVALVDEKTAKAFVQKHHYSGSLPPTRVRVGLFWKESAFHVEELAGVAVFSVPIQSAAIPRYLGVEPSLGVELGRFCLLDHIKANGESWFIARALRALKQILPNNQGVISYCDPVPRYAEDGSCTKPGHLGTIYRATNARHHGHSRARTLLLTADGRIVSERTLSKIRLGESGAAYAIRQLESLGAPPRQINEDGVRYVERVLESGCFRKIAHPGNLVFSFGGVRS